LEEVAKLGNFDEQDEQFREVFYDILQSKGMREPESDILEEKNEKTVMKIENCVLIDDGLMKYIDQEDEKEKQEWARKYRDKLKDHIDVTYADRDEGIPQRVYIDFDEELEILLGQSATSRDI
jgi:tRNA/tmRNA/rRNA uracil-C5-methylase (TrmA/RlmC/RlmD family)